MAQFKIRDGYTLKGKAELDGTTINFEYRRSSPEDTYEYLESVKGKCDGKTRIDATVKVLLKYCLTWDVLDLEDKPTAVSKDVLTHPDFPWQFLESMLNIITSYSQAQNKADLKN